jgi:hypothetical protein
VSLLYVASPVALQVERVQSVLLKPNVCIWVNFHDLLSAITPQTFQRVLERRLPVHFEDMLLQSLQIMQLCCAFLPLALV